VRAGPRSGCQSAAEPEGLGEIRRWLHNRLADVTVPDRPGRGEFGAGAFAIWLRRWRVALDVDVCCTGADASRLMCLQVDNLHDAFFGVLVFVRMTLAAQDDGTLPGIRVHLG
jgi:hypothetical protein